MITLVLATLGLAALFWLIEAYFQRDPPAGAAAVLPTLVAAMVTGDRYAKRHDAMPYTSVAWRFAWLATGLQLVLSFGVLVLIVSLDPAARQVLSQPDFAPFLIALVAFASLLILLMNRFMLRTGAKSVLRQQAKRGG